jgi:hypothetical protein
MIANPKGEVRFEAGGATYTIVYTNAVLADLETELDAGIFQILQKLGDASTLRIAFVATVLRAGLRKHHPDADAMVLIDAFGGIMPALVTIATALKAALGIPDDNAAVQPAATEVSVPLAPPKGAKLGSKAMAAGSKSALPLTPSGT